MDRVINEMAKAKGDVEKRYREKIPEIIRECMAFAYLGKSFTFNANADLENRVNQRLIELSDEILSDIEERARKVIQYAEEEDDEAMILAYMKREREGEDLITRIDKHNSNFRYFLEGWIAIGMVNGLSETGLLTNILTFAENPFVSPLWQKAFSEGYLSNAIRTRGYSFGKGNLRNPMMALTELGRNSINEAFQYGSVLRYGKLGAIGYRTHRASSFDCAYCDELTLRVFPLTMLVLPAHPRCVCFCTPVYGTDLSESERLDLFSQKNDAIKPNVQKSSRRISLTDEQKAYRKELSKRAMDNLRGRVVNNNLAIHFSRAGIDEYLNQPHAQYFEKNEAVLVLDKMLESATYLGINPSYVREGVKHSHIFEAKLLGNSIWFVVREYNDGRILFHSCSDSSKIATDLIQKQP